MARQGAIHLGAVPQEGAEHQTVVTHPAVEVHPEETHSEEALVEEAHPIHRDPEDRQEGCTAIRETDHTVIEYWN